jgi:hypothetical protein
MRKSDKITCEQIEKIFINKQIDKISEGEKQILITHLDSCENCKKYHVVFDEIQNVLAIEQKGELFPKPEIREHLLNRMKENQPLKENVLGSLLSNLKSVFSYRIPVYQAAVGIICLFLISFALGKVPSQDRIIKSDERAINSINELSLSHTNILDSLEILNKQKIGLNVSEDTVFTKYINATM